jgi:serine kinase of HPr protein (carbohydrate metabolism regulator)
MSITGRVEREIVVTKRIFSYEGINVSAESEYAEDINWLTEFLDPWFEDQAGLPDVEVTLQVDRNLHEALMSYGALDRQVDAYILDTSILKYPVWDSPGPELVSYEQKHDLFYLIEGNRISLLTASYSVRSRISLMRVIREFAMGMAQISGGRFLHASAFSAGDRATVITGPREAGKTTLLTYILSNSEADFIANDRLLVKRDGQGALLKGMPTIISIRSGTLEFFPELLDSIQTQGFNARLTCRECHDSDATKRTNPREDKYGLTTRQFCSLFSCNPIKGAKPVTMLFPLQTGRPGGLSLRKLAPGETRDRLANSLFNNIAPDRLSDVFTPRNPGHEDSLIFTDHALCEWLSSNITAFECRLGTNTYETPEGAIKILNAMDANPDTHPRATR